MKSNPAPCLQEWIVQAALACKDTHCPLRSFWYKSLHYAKHNKSIWACTESFSPTHWSIALLPHVCGCGYGYGCVNHQMSCIWTAWGGGSLLPVFLETNCEGFWFSSPPNKNCLWADIVNAAWKVTSTISLGWKPQERLSKLAFCKRFSDATMRVASKSCQIPLSAPGIFKYIKSPIKAFLKKSICKEARISGSERSSLNKIAIDQRAIFF